MAKSGCIALLVVNRIPELDRIAITSILESTKSDIDIYVGYTNLADISFLPNHSRVHRIDLSNLYSTSFANYQGYETSEFFRIVILKWELFLILLSEYKYEFLVYSDIDVLWLKNPIPGFTNFFTVNKKAHLLVQNFSIDLDQPKLCMGFVAIRNSDVAKHIISSCLVEHRKQITLDSRTGDDGIITDYYEKNGFPEAIQMLPQISFPLGNQIDLYRFHSIFPGITTPRPYIFHANYTVGHRSKLRLLYLFLRVSKSSTTTYISKRLKLLLFCEIGLRKIKKYILLNLDIFGK